MRPSERSRIRKSNRRDPRRGAGPFWARLYGLVVIGAVTLGGTHAWLSDLLSDPPAPRQAETGGADVQAAARYALDRAEVLLGQARLGDLEPEAAAEIERLHGVFVALEGGLDCDPATARRAEAIVSHWAGIGDQWPGRDDAGADREATATLLCERLVEAIRCLCGGC